MIRVEGLSVHYGAHCALRDVTLQLERGHIMAIVGPSGCGKSSFLSALNRMTDLVPGARIGGRVMVDGQDAAGLTPVELRRRVGMVFQVPSPFPMSVRNNVQVPLREHGFRDRDELEARLERALRDVGLWDEVCGRLNRSALELSGGQQQRLCIARALALEPAVLLMDEPCSSLDPMASAVVEDLILGLRDRVSLAVVTHNLAQARRIANEVAVFWITDGAGTVIEQGCAERVFEQPTNPIAADYLGGAVG